MNPDGGGPAKENQPEETQLAGPKRRRRAVYLSEIDKKRLAQGLAPSWEDEPDLGIIPAQNPEVAAQELDSNDSRLRAEIPPHW